MKINDIYESTTSGSVAPVAMPMTGGVQSRSTGTGIYPAKKGGNLLTGKKTSKKYANSIAESKQIEEAHLDEEELIIIPGQGHKLKSGFIPHAEDRRDHEVSMARSDLFQAAKNAKQTFEMLQDVSEDQGVEGWVQAKITKAADYLATVREYLEGKQVNRMAGGINESLDWQNDPMNWQGDDEDTEWYEKHARSPLFMVVVAAGTKYTRKNTKKRIINFTKTSPTAAQVDVGRLGPHSGIINIDFNRQAMGRVGPADEPEYDDQAHTYRRFYVGDRPVTAEQAFNLFQYKKHKASTPSQSKIKWAPVDEGAKVDRMVKHIEKSERGLGKSKDKASDIAWATANKRGMLDNKNKK